MNNASTAELFRASNHSRALMNHLVNQRNVNPILPSLDLDDIPLPSKEDIEIYSEIFSKQGINKNNQRGGRKYTALLIAASQRNPSLIKYLLSLPGINVNKRTTNGETALHLAVKNRDVNSVKLLVNHPDIDVNCKTRPFRGAEIRGGFCTGRMPIQEVTLNAEILKVLLETGKVNNEGIEYLLNLRKIDEDIQMVIQEYVKEHPLRPKKKQGIWKTNNSTYFQIKLLMFIQNNFENRTQPYLEDILRISKHFKDELKTALESLNGWNSWLDHIRNDCIMFFSEILLRKEEDIRNEALEILKDILEYGNRPDIKALVEIENINNHFNISVKVRQNFADNRFDTVHSESMTPLIWAIYNNNIELVLDLLNSDEIDINLRIIKQAYHYWSEYIYDIPDTETALMVAIKQELPLIIDLLVKRPDLQINLVNIMDNSTALMYAADFNQPETLKKLLAHPDIDPNMKTIHGHSACSYAAKKGHLESLKVLLDSPKVAKWNLRFALKEAAEHNHIHIVSYCLERGNEDNIVKFRRAKHHAYFIAASNGNADIVRLLLESKSIKIWKHYHKFNYSGVGTNAINPQFYDVNALILAIKAKSPETVKVLLDAKVFHSYEDEAGNTPIIYAIDMLTEKNSFMETYPKMYPILKLLLSKNNLSMYDSHSIQVEIYKKIKRDGIMKLFSDAVDNRNKAICQELTRISFYRGREPYLAYDILHNISNYLLSRINVFKNHTVEKKEEYKQKNFIEITKHLTVEEFFWNNFIFWKDDYGTVYTEDNEDGYVYICGIYNEEKNEVKEVTEFKQDRMYYKDKSNEIYKLNDMGKLEYYGRYDSITNRIIRIKWWTISYDTEIELKEIQYENQIYYKYEDYIYKQIGEKSFEHYGYSHYGRVIPYIQHTINNVIYYRKPDNTIYRVWDNYKWSLHKVGTWDEDTNSLVETFKNVTTTKNFVKKKVVTRL